MNFRTILLSWYPGVYSNEIVHSKLKRMYINRGIMLLIAVLFISLPTFGQCETDASLNNCASNLGTFTYIKSFVADVKPKKKANSEFSYVFSTGSTYIMIACTDNVVGARMIMDLYDFNNSLIASNWDEKNKKLYNELKYPCSATGVYHIKLNFENTKKGCGLCILGFCKD